MASFERNMKHSQNPMFTSYNLPEQLDDFVELYEQELNNASLFQNQYKKIEDKKIVRDFYLKSANELANIYNDKISFEEYNKVKNIIYDIDEENLRNKFIEQLNNIIKIYKKHSNDKIFFTKFKELVVNLTQECESKFKQEEKEIAKFDLSVERTKNDIKISKEVVLNVNIGKLLQDKKLLDNFMNKMYDYKFLNQKTKVLLHNNFNEKELHNDETPYIYEETDLAKTKTIIADLRRMGFVNILFSEYFDENEEEQPQWKFSAVNKTNKYIVNIMKKIKNNNLTPYETMIFLHSVATLVPYSERSQKKGFNQYNLGELRSVVGMVNKKEAVCTAYSHFIKAIVSGLNNKDLTADINCCYIKDGAFNSNVYRFLSGGNHAQNLITINDEKYKINGVYRNDCAWDAIRLDEKTGKTKKLQTYTFFMNPIPEIFNMKNIMYKPYNMVSMKDFDVGFLKSSESYKMAKLQTQMAKKEETQKKSNPIPLEKFIYAFKSTFSKMGMDKSAINKALFAIIKNSKNYAQLVFEEGCNNTFYYVLDKDLSSFQTHNYETYFQYLNENDNVK